MANRESVNAKRVQSFDEADQVGPGAFLWEVTADRRCILFMLPGETFLRTVQVAKGPPQNENVWGWDGNEDSPTLRPSLDAKDIKTCKASVWHGYLTDGRFVSC